MLCLIVCAVPSAETKQNGADDADDVNDDDDDDDDDEGEETTRYDYCCISVIINK